MFGIRQGKLMKRIIMHIDVNSAYLAWEAAYRLQHGASLDLRTIPAAVGGDPDSRRGIILAKSIPAKKFKIQTGEPLFAALAKCPGLVIVRPNYPLYRQCSQALKAMLANYSPLIQQFSVDEFFLDYTGMERFPGEAVTRARAIKAAVKETFGFTVNIGIAGNKLLAKMASELEKPDLVHTLFPAEIPSKLWPLPVEALFGIGRATSRKLRDRGIRTIGEVAACDPGYLKRLLKGYGVLLWHYANGRDDSPVRPNGAIPVQGMSNTTTLPFDVEDRQTAHLVFLSLAETIGMRLRQGAFGASLLAVSLKTHDFLYTAHQKRLAVPTDCTALIHTTACELFDALWRGEPLRQLGIRVSGLSGSGLFQPSLFDAGIDQQRKIDQAVDCIRLKYGAQAVFRSVFLQSGLSAFSGGVIEAEDYPLMGSWL
jgi:DNA polymerase-4